MKYGGRDSHKARFEVGIVADNQKLVNEFEISIPQERVMQCYIPVEDGQNLKIVCEVTHIMKGSIIDLVVDGILRDSFRLRYKGRNKLTFVFDSGHYAHKRSLRKGKLTVHSEPQTNTYSHGPARIGTIEVRLHRALPGSAYFSKKDVPGPEDVLHYRELTLPWNSFDVAPDCDLTFTGDQLLAQSQRIAFRKLMNDERAGLAACTTMRYIYRTAASLIAAEKMPDDAQEFAPYFPSIDREIAEELAVGDEEDDQTRKENSKEHRDSDINTLRSSKRKHEEVDDLVDNYVFGTPMPAGSLNARARHDEFDEPPKRSKDEKSRLESEVRNLKYAAETARKKAMDTRTKITERIRRKTQEESEFDRLLKEKKSALEEIKRYNYEDEMYLAKLNSEED